MGWLGRTYSVELPRVLRELRWLMLLMALIHVAGVAAAYYGNTPGYMGMAELQQGYVRPSGAAMPHLSRYFGSLMLRKTAPVWDRWTYWMFPFTSSPVWGSGWPGYLVPDSPPIGLPSLLGQRHARRNAYPKRMEHGLVRVMAANRCAPNGPLGLRPWGQRGQSSPP